MQKGSIFLAFVFLLLACDDPSGVGLGALDDLANPPQRTTYEPTHFNLDDSFNDVTGGTDGQVNENLLMGMVDEQGLFQGTSYEVIASVDFAGNAAVSSTFRNGPLTYVALELVPEYIYGDTTATLSFDLFEMDAEWTSSNAYYDSLYAAPKSITTATISSLTDSLITIPLPSSWYATIEETLRGTASTFANDFHGIQFRPKSGNAILGISTLKSRLKAISGGDTTSFNMSPTKFHSYIKRTGTFTQPSDAWIVQDNTGDAIEVALDISSLNLGEVAISGGAFRLEVDTTQIAGEGVFRRNMARNLSLFGETEAGLQIQLATGTVMDNEVVLASQILNNVIQNIVVGKSAYTRFFIAPQRAIVSNSLNFFVVKNGSATEKPKLILTYIPTN